MKNILLKLFSLFFLFSVHTEAQDAPEWIHHINTLPDSAMLFPVRTINDGNNNILVLSTYEKNLGGGALQYKIYLTKYNDAGILAWTFIFDNNGNNEPRGFDMAIDYDGNAYIAGAFMETSLDQPLILKVNPLGNLVWQKDSTNGFNTSSYDQIIYKNNSLFVKASSGVAKFDTSGTELWSTPLPAGRMAVDDKGQTIVSVYFGNPTNIVRLDTSGVINFSDVSTVNAKRIAVDADNSFYLLEDNSFPGKYTLVKYDSAGVLQWTKNDLPDSPPFGDIGFDVLVDYSNNVLLVGIADTILKFSPAGNLLWKKPMNGLDSYIISAKIAYNNLLFIAGSVQTANGYDIKVATYNLNGNQNWTGIYNGNDLGQEFMVDLSPANYGIYVVENNANNTTLVKFALPFQFGNLNYDFLCVDSIWYDELNPSFINVKVFNGDINFVNYPTVQIISPGGDTISNKHHVLNFFGQLNNSFQTYHDSIYVTGITDFTGYTFLFYAAFPDTAVVIYPCQSLTNKMILLNDNEFSIYPNPATDKIFIRNNNLTNTKYHLTIYNITGCKVLDKEIIFDDFIIDVVYLISGIYFIRLTDGKNIIQSKFIKE